MVDIYATEVRPFEEGYYWWFEGFVDAARRGEWDKVPQELRGFVERRLRELQRKLAAVARAEARALKRLEREAIKSKPVAEPLPKARVRRARAAEPEAEQIQAPGRAGGGSAAV